jgi:hypothetical protein
LPAKRGPTEEEALLRRESVDFLLACLWVFLKRFLQRGISQL